MHINYLFHQIVHKRRRKRCTALRRHDTCWWIGPLFFLRFVSTKYHFVVSEDFQNPEPPLDKMTATHSKWDAGRCASLVHCSWCPHRLSTACLHSCLHATMWNCKSDKNKLSESSSLDSNYSAPDAADFCRRSLTSFSSNLRLPVNVTCRSSELHNGNIVIYFYPTFKYGPRAVVKVQNQRWRNATFRFGPLTMVVCLSLAL